MSSIESRISDIEHQLSNLKEVVENSTEQMNLLTIIAEKNRRIEILEAQLNAKNVFGVNTINTTPNQYSPYGGVRFDI